MIKSFRHKGLRELFETGHSVKIAAKLAGRLIVRLDALHYATALTQLNLPGFEFHALRGKPRRYTIHVNGPWCVTFEWEGNDAWRVDFEQYH